MDRLPFWAVFSKLMIRRVGERTRVYIEVPLGNRKRAEHLRSMIGGRIEEGTVHVEGDPLPEAMRLLGYPREMVDLIGELRELKGSPGVPTPDYVLEKRDLVIDSLRAAAKAAYAEL